MSANLRSSKMRKLWAAARAARREVKVVIASGVEKGMMSMWVFAQQIRGPRATGVSEEGGGRRRESGYCRGGTRSRLRLSGRG